MLYNKYRKMKTFIRATFVILVAIILNSCDKVEGPVKEVLPPPAGDRNVLVEDYTGHRCGNCPRAAKSVYDLKATYGDNLIIMGIHAGGFANVLPPSAPYYTYDFRTPEGTELDTDFGISVAGNPNGMVNRRQVNGSYILPPTKWLDEISAVLTNPEPLPLSISINNVYNSATRSLQTEVKTEFFANLSGVYKMCVFMVEDSIVNWQKDYDASPEDIEFYVHQEVFRGSMNGTYGVQIGTTSLGDISTLNYSKTLDAAWSDEHFSIIAYLYNDLTKEIIQVEQKEIIE